MERAFYIFWLYLYWERSWPRFGWAVALFSRVRLVWVKRKHKTAGSVELPGLYFWTTGFT